MRETVYLFVLVPNLFIYLLIYFEVMSQSRVLKSADWLFIET